MKVVIVLLVSLAAAVLAILAAAWPGSPLP
jgi:hypothetical protein